MKKKKLLIFLSIALALSALFSISAVNVFAETKTLKPISWYNFADEKNLGKDVISGYDLTTKGVVVQSEVGVASFNGNSALYYSPLETKDVTDCLEEVTVTLWAKRPSTQNKHSFMLSTGVANSKEGFGIGFYETNSGAIFVEGNVGDSAYAANYKFPGDTAHYVSGENTWNMFSLRLKKDSGQYGINGGSFAINSIGAGGISIQNLTQTLTLGGIVNNAGESFYWGYNGELADVRIYDTYLSDSDISSIYGGGKNGSLDLVKVDKFIKSVDNTPSVFADAKSDSAILKAVNNAKVTATDSSDIKQEVSVIWNKIDKTNSAYALVSGVVYKKGCSNADMLKATLKVNYADYKSISMNTIFQDNMVLQRDKRLKIFGYGGDIGNTVNVSFNGVTKSSLVTSEGFTIYLDAMSAKKVGIPLVIRYYIDGIEQAYQTITINNVVLGDVFLCSGQSNMAVTLTYIANKKANVVDDYKSSQSYNLLRVYDQPYRDTSSTPVIDTTAITSWKTLENVNDIYNFSAFATAYGLQLASAMNNEIPIGLIISAVGGSCIEEWIDSETMSGLESTAESMGKINSRYYNNMIHSFTSYTLAGILWYQGEANVRTPDLYKKQITAYVNSYRALFEDANLPIIVMQLPQFCDWTPWYDFREMQWSLMNGIENLYVTCGIDLGSNVSPNAEAIKQDTIHPTDKWQYAERAVAISKKYMYKLTPKDNEPYGLSPSIVKAQKYDGKIILTLNNSATIKKGEGIINGFEVLTSQGYEKATAEISNNKIILSYTKNNPTAIRYLYADYFSSDTAFIYNEYNLPLAPKKELIVEEEKIQIEVTVGENGSSTANNLYSINSGEKINFTITANKGFKAVVKVNGIEVYFSGVNFTSAAMLKNSVIDITFIPISIKHTISVTTNGHCEVTPATVEVDEGGSKIFTIKTDKGYEIKSVEVLGKEIKVENNQFVIENIVDDVSVVVTTKKQSTNCKSVISSEGLLMMFGLCGLVLFLKKKTAKI